MWRATLPEPPKMRVLGAMVVESGIFFFSVLRVDVGVWSVVAVVESVHVCQYSIE